ncbi:MAG: putative metal-dependent membrane protease [halophilic archaeon J07HX64]|nr:MAG: putative metal-dependent membrane protease [halophilic archaeon J07HX64]
MPQWGPFFTVVAVLTVLLLVLARQSQQVISDGVDSGTEQTSSKQTNDRSQLAGDQTGASAGRPADTPAEAVDDTPVGTADNIPTDTPAEIADNTLTDTPAGTTVDETGGSGTANSRDGGVTSEAGSGVPGAPPDSKQTPDFDTQAGDSGVQAGDVELTSRLMLANVASTQALFAGVVVTAAWYFSIPADAFGVFTGSPAAGLRAVALGVGFGAVLWLANELATTVADAVGAAYDESVRGLLAPESTGGWVGLLLVVLPLVALAEELLFRAALIGVPAAGFGVSPWLLAVVASLAFALGHGAQGQVGVVVTGLLGLVLAAGYILTGSLLVVVVAHYVINAMEFLFHEFLEVETVWPFAVRSG